MQSVAHIIASIDLLIEALKFYVIMGILRESTVLVVMLVSLLLIGKLGSCDHYLITPNYFTHECLQTSKTETCATLQDFAEQNNDSIYNYDRNITLNFLPGEHLLTQPIEISSAVDITLTGSVCDLFQCVTQIKCQNTNGFYIQNVQSVNIVGLEFSGCMGDQKNGGAVYMKNIDTMVIRNCRFTNNHVSGVLVFGGAVYIHTVPKVSIVNSYFANNSAQCSHTSVICIQIMTGGGALHFYNSEVLIDHCNLINNTALIGGGAIVSLQNTQLNICETNFADNNVKLGAGGALYAEFGSLTLTMSNYTNNKAGTYGGAVSSKQTSVDILQCIFTNNFASKNGGAIAYSIQSTTGNGLNCSDTHFVANVAVNLGGAVFIFASSLTQSGVLYSRNRAKVGGAIHMFGEILSSSNDHYLHNLAIENPLNNMHTNEKTIQSANLNSINKLTMLGGAICILNGFVLISDSRFEGNTADFHGGARFLFLSTVHGSNDSFKNNVAILGAGGAVYSFHSTINDTNSTYLANRAGAGGAIYTVEGNVTSHNSQFENNTVKYIGGAVCCTSIKSLISLSESTINTYLTITGSNFSNNSASLGGAIQAGVGCFLIISRSNYRHNIASHGGAVCVVASEMHTSDSIYTNNTASNGGAIYVDKSNAAIGSQCDHEPNVSLCWKESDNTFLYNSASKGGAISSLGSNITSYHSHYINNTATDGGAVYSVTSTLDMSCALHSNNMATRAGGCLYIDNSHITTTKSRYEKNQAGLGAVIHIFNGSVTTTDSLYVYNTAQGGAVFAARMNSCINSVRSNYSNNSVQVGGAVMYLLNSNISNSYSSYAGNWARTVGGAIFANTSTISDFHSYYVDNSAGIAGGAIVMFGGVLFSNNSQFIHNRAITRDGGAIYSGEVKSVIFVSNGYIAENRGYQSGAVYGFNADVACSRSQFIDNYSSKYGGVMYVIDGSISTTDCIYSGNRADVIAGALLVTNGTFTSKRNKYINNSAGSTGGAIATYQSSVYTSNDDYTSNRALAGGAVAHHTCAKDNTQVISIDNNYTNNSARDSGGAFISIECIVIESNNYYTSNSAKNSGGAMILSSNSANISRSQYTNNVASDGGAIGTIGVSLTISDTDFTNNTVDGSGGAIGSDGQLSEMSFSISNTNFTNNYARDGGAFSIGRGFHISFVNCYFIHNYVSAQGGALKIDTSNVTISNCSFLHNEAAQLGGAVSLDRRNLSLVNCLYNHNKANGLIGGGVLMDSGFVFSSSSQFKHNFGGAIYVLRNGGIISSNCTYENNSGHKGGALYINKGNILNSNNHFFNNSAVYAGGAVYVNSSSNISSEYCTYINNTASFGGVFFGYENTTISSFGCLFESNQAVTFGGAIGSFGGTITTSNTTFANNTANLMGGALVIAGHCFCSKTHFVKNWAGYSGGAIYTTNQVHSSNCNYVSNHADRHGGAIYAAGCSDIVNITLFYDANLKSDFETCYLQSYYLHKLTPNTSQLNFINHNLFLNNTCGITGGAITSVQTDLYFDETVIRGNMASYGSGLALIHSTATVHGQTEITYNQATVGGGIMSFQSVININSSSTNISSNTALLSGGGLYGNNTNVRIFRGKVHFGKNKAKIGGGIFLDYTSKLQLYKKKQEAVKKHNLLLEFTGNFAYYGGAVCIFDIEQACEIDVNGTGTEQGYVQECFIQTVLFATVQRSTLSANFINVFFKNNTARFSGDDIYGGLLDRCVLNPSAKLVKVYPGHATFTGFDYIRATSEFYGLVDYDNLTSTYDPDKLINAIPRSDVKGLISSDPLRVCFCLDHLPNCSYYHQRVHTKRGQLFHLSVVAVDQVGNPVNATVISSFISNNGNLNVDQARQDIYAQCTELEYNVYPKGDSKSSQLELYADGPCTDLGISKRVLDVIFLSCTCPVGFHPVETETLCRCECDPILRSYILGCSYENETILLDTNGWIDYVNTSIGSGYIIYDPCPFDYCVQEPVNVNLNVPDGANVQCAFNRSGKICGACQKNLSLVMGSSRCMECSDDFLTLIIPFTLAGIALVAFILILNLTVATGTLHGLIFYANILAASSSTFMPIDTPVFLKMFVSWINLDLGIEACFYNGMDSYGKVLLQLVFPVYIILLSVLIIIISEHSLRFAMVLGRKDPVATLSTLILLSYSKLIRTIIASLQFTYLAYPDGSREIVWLYDANVPYFKISHIPRFILASVIIILGSVYTVLLLFGQWIPRCENRFIRWANNPKYNAFIIKYHAPFSPKHRYWIGLLLFARILHYIVAAFVSESAILLSVICIVLSLLIFKIVFAHSGYNNRSFNSLESSFLLNLGIFAAVTYYLSQTTETNQAALAGVSLTVTFLTFVGILIYHFYAYILKGTQLWEKITRLRPRLHNARNRRPIYQPLPEPEPGEDEEFANGERNREDIEMHPLYTDENNELVDLPHDYVPPVITPAVRYSQERREFDGLDSPTDNDYRQINRHPVPRPRQVPTSTVIDIFRHGREDEDSD